MAGNNPKIDSEESECKPNSNIYQVPLLDYKKIKNWQVTIPS